MKSVFISSTFKDMQAERDYLHERVFSRLRKLAGQYGEDIQELDLRWGVDTYQMSEEESGYQVLKVCIDAIDRCKPYIIVLLGDRYGWIPDASLVDSMQDMRLNAQYETSMSITNLEIKYGALSEEETLKRCIFCFRNPDFVEAAPEELRAVYLAESPEHEKKLNALKEQIRRKEDAKIIDYRVKWDEERQMVSGLEQLGEEIYRLLEEQLKKDLAGREAKNQVQQYILDAKGTKERYLASYTPRLYEEKKAVEGMNFMAGDTRMLYHSKYKTARKNRQCMHLTGPAGGGKSALMAALEQQAADAGAETILYFSGNPGCQSPETLKSVIIYRMEEILSIPHNETYENKNAYLRILDEKAKGRLIYCFIDALDQLFANQQNLYLEIIGVCPNLYVITSALDTFPYRKSLLGAVEILAIEVRKFMDEEKKSLVQMTGTYRGKTIDEVLKEKICAKESSDNPLFLSLILQRLFAMRKAEFERAEHLAPGIDGLHLYMEYLIDDMPENVTEAAVQLFEHVEEMFGSAFLKEVSYLIALSETGLSEREIEGILRQQSVEFSQLKFQEILFYLYDVFTENADGKWMYSHRIFQEAMRREAKPKESEIRGYFIQYSEEDPEFLKREGYYHILKNQDARGREVLEECRTWESFGQVKSLVRQMILEEEAAETYFLEMSEDTGFEELFAFWKSVDQRGEDRRIEAFLWKIYHICARKEELPAELRVEALYYTMGKVDLEESIAQIRTARRLLPKITDADTRRLWGIKIDYMDAWNLLDTGKGGEGLARMKSEIDDAQSLLADMAADPSRQEHREIVEEALAAYIWHSRNYMMQNRRRFKKYLPQHMESVLALYDRYPEYTRMKRFRLFKIDLYLEGAMQYSQTVPERSRQYAGEAVELARRLSDEEPDAKVLELLARSLNYYGHSVDREHRYQYRYEALDVYRRIYQMEQTDYWKEEVAAQAAFFAEDVDLLTRQLKLDDRDGWGVKGRDAWKLCLSYYEELEEKGYAFHHTDYVDCLLDCAEEAVFEYHVKDAVIYAKKACDCLKENREKGWEPKSKKDLFRCWQAFALAAENLDDRLCAEEAVPYSYESIDWAKRLYEAAATQQTLSYILASLQITARILYHTGRDEEAFAIAREAEEWFAHYQREYCQRFPGGEYEIRYILSRLFLKKNDTEQARKYAELLKEYEESGQLDFQQKGQMILLKGDLLFAEEEYGAAKDIYLKGFRHWRESHEAVKKNIQTTVGFQLRNGKITRDTEERLWHVKTFYYYMYTLFQKAEASSKGQLGDKYDRPYLEYLDLYKRCMEGAKTEAYRPAAEAFLFRAMDRMVTVGKEEQWSGICNQEILSRLCQLIGYGKKKGLNMDRQYEVLADAFSHYDLFMLEIALEFSEETVHCWIDIYQYLKQKSQEGMKILPCNGYMIGFMWMKMGCYEEAYRWLDTVPEGAKRYKYAKLASLFCLAMCASHDKEEEKSQDVMEKIEVQKRKGTEDWGNMLRGMYQELTGSVSGLLEKAPKKFRLQEEAQRYLNVLKMIADQGTYDSLTDKAKENFWIAGGEIRDAYYKWNERIPGKEDGKDCWEDRAAAMKELTAGGMTWQVGFAEFEEELYTVFWKIYEACAEEEEKQKIAERIAEFWRKEYEKTDLKRLSARNLQMLRKTEQVTGRALFPRLEEELALRLNEKAILHDFFGKIPEYSGMDDWKERPRSRIMEVRDIFERLLVQDVDEWAEDFKRWIAGEMWIVGHMKFFERPETLDLPEKRPLYGVYCQYLTEFKESSRARWIANIRECEG